MKTYSLILWVPLMILIGCSPSNRSNRVKLMFNQANQKLADGHHGDAIDLYNQVIDFEPELTDAYLNRGVAYYNNGKYVLALADYNEVYRQKPDFHDLLFNRAYVYTELGRPNAAIEDLNQLASLYPDTALVDLAKGLAYQKAKQSDKAIESFSIAIHKDANQFDAYANRGALLYEQGKYNEAKLDLLKALELHENEPYTLNSLALTYADMGVLNKADSCIEIAMRLVGNQSYFINNAGYISYLQDSLSQADSLINISLKLDPNNAWAHKNKGLVLLEKDKGKALVAFEKSIELDTVLTKYYIKVISRYLSIGEKNKACFLFKSLNQYFDENVNNPCI